MLDHVHVVETDPDYPSVQNTERSNSLGQALDRLFQLWGRDPQNPFADDVAPGGTVVIKPNWVLHANRLGHNIDSLITHSSLIQAVIDRVAIALDGRGRIVVGDSPLQTCGFEKMLAINGMQTVARQVRERYPHIDLEMEDWRLTVLDPGKNSEYQAGSPAQRSRDAFGKRAADTHQVVDLANDSFLEEIADYADRFRVTKYKPSLMTDHHSHGKHEYLVTKRIFEADLVINMPKMKTHVKAGLTAALKNLVGINGHKEYLPHHIKGSYFSGGDNYCMPNRIRGHFEQVYDRLWERYSELPKLKRRACSYYLRTLWRLSRLIGSEGISGGEWSGNETIWRTTLDLNHILYFSQRSPRKVISIVDGIIAGEGRGPLVPTPKPAGMLIGGENPAHVDAAVAMLMGYNLARIPTVYQAIFNRKSKFGTDGLDAFPVRTSFKDGGVEECGLGQLPNLGFEKPKYWRRAETVPLARAA